ncbi:MAG: phospholipid carrier-dependent glycosyltransferase [bacterium]|nr:phospholipid carrier-dependent glycosyltransferase [bacterium]
MDRWLLVVLVAALAVRLVALWAASDSRPVLDEELYLVRANALLDGEGYVGSFQSWVRHPYSPSMVELKQYPGAYQPPVYITFLAGVLALTGRSLLAIKLAQVLLGTATVGILYWIGRSWFDRRTALAAATICALYPNLIAFTHYLWSETVFVFLLTLGMGLLTRRRELPGWAGMVGVGLFLGLAALTRSLILYFVPVLVVWALVVHRRQWRATVPRIGLMIAVIALVIAPWTVRNWSIHGGLVLVETNGPFNLWRGNTPNAYRVRPKPPAESYRPPFESIPLMPVVEQWAPDLVAQAKQMCASTQPSDLEVIACARQLAWECIRNDPAGFARRAGYKIVDLWNPTSFLMRRMQSGAYGPMSPRWESAIAWSAVVSYGLVVVLALAVLWRVRREPRVWLVVLLVLFVTLVHAVVFGLSRFRLPLMPFIILLGGHAVVMALHRWTSPTSRLEAPPSPAGPE